MRPFILAFVLTVGATAMAGQLVWQETNNADGTRTYTASLDGHTLTVQNNPQYAAEWHSEVDGDHWCGPFSSIGEGEQQALDTVNFTLNDVDMLMYKGHRIDAVSDTSGYYYNYMIDYHYNEEDLYFETRLTAMMAAKSRIDRGDIPK